MDYKTFLAFLAVIIAASNVEGQRGRRPPNPIIQFFEAPLRAFGARPGEAVAVFEPTLSRAGNSTSGVFSNLSNLGGWLAQRARLTSARTTPTPPIIHVQSIPAQNLDSANSNSTTTANKNSNRPLLAVLPNTIDPSTLQFKTQLQLANRPNVQLRPQNGNVNRNGNQQIRFRPNQDDDDDDDDNEDDDVFSDDDEGFVPQNVRLDYEDEDDDDLENNVPQLGVQQGRRDQGSNNNNVADEDDDDEDGFENEVPTNPVEKGRIDQGDDDDEDEDEDDGEYGVRYDDGSDYTDEDPDTDTAYEGPVQNPNLVGPYQVVQAHQDFRDRIHNQQQAAQQQQLQQQQQFQNQFTQQLQQQIQEQIKKQLLAQQAQQLQQAQQNQQSQYQNQQSQYQNQHRPQKQPHKKPPPKKQTTPKPHKKETTERPPVSNQPENQYLLVQNQGGNSLPIIIPVQQLPISNTGNNRVQYVPISLNQLGNVQQLGLQQSYPSFLPQSVSVVAQHTHLVHQTPPQHVITIKPVESSQQPGISSSSFAPHPSSISTGIPERPQPASESFTFPTPTRRPVRPIPSTTRPNTHFITGQPQRVTKRPSNKKPSRRRPQRHPSTTQEEDYSEVEYNIDDEAKSSAKDEKPTEKPKETATEKPTKVPETTEAPKAQSRSAQQQFYVPEGFFPLQGGLVQVSNNGRFLLKSGRNLKYAEGTDVSSDLPVTVDENKNSEMVDTAELTVVTDTKQEDQEEEPVDSLKKDNEQHIETIHAESDVVKKDLTDIKMEIVKDDKMDKPEDIKNMKENEKDEKKETTEPAQMTEEKKDENNSMMMIENKVAPMLKEHAEPEVEPVVTVAPIDEQKMEKVSDEKIVVVPQSKPEEVVVVQASSSSNEMEPPTPTVASKTTNYASNHAVVMSEVVHEKPNGHIVVKSDPVVPQPDVVSKTLSSSTPSPTSSSTLPSSSPSSSSSTTTTTSSSSSSTTPSTETLSSSSSSISPNLEETVTNHRVNRGNLRFSTYDQYVNH